PLVRRGWWGGVRLPSALLGRPAADDRGHGSRDRSPPPPAFPVHLPGSRLTPCDSGGIKGPLRFIYTLSKSLVRRAFLAANLADEPKPVDLVARLQPQ